MVNSYEYLITSLPSLTLLSPPSYTLEELNESASDQLSHEKFQKFQQMNLWQLDVCPTSAITSLRDFYFDLKKEISGVRKAKVNNQSISTFILPEGFSLRNPLEAELAIHKALWEKIEDLAFGHYFDFTEVLFYKLKLQLLVRQFSFNAEAGMKKVKGIILSQKEKEE